MLFALAASFGILILHGDRLKNCIVNCNKLQYLIVKTFSVTNHMACKHGLYAGSQKFVNKTFARQPLIGGLCCH